jgi:hypothetical protein
MSRPARNRIACKYFVWNLFRRDNVFYADGRLNNPNVGKHSLGTRDRETAFELLTDLDQKMAELHLEVKAEPKTSSISIVEGWKRYSEHTARPDVLGGAGTGTQKRYRAVRSKHEQFCKLRGISHWNEIAKQHISAYGTHLKQSGYSDATIYLECTLVKQIVKWLIEEEKALPESNRVRLALRRSEESTTYAFSLDEVSAMIDLCQRDPKLRWLADVIIALVTTGMRIGELGSVWKQHFEIPAYHRKLKHPMEVNRQLFESRTDTAVLLQPPDTLLHHAPATVGFPVKFHPPIPSGRFVVLVRDDGFDPTFFQPVTDVSGAVALIRGKFLRLATSFPAPTDQARHGLSDDRFEPPRFTDLSGGHFDAQRSAVAVSNQMELGSKPASAAAQRVVRRLIGVAVETFFSAPAAARAARTLAPSTHQSSQSISPCSSSLTCNVSTIVVKTPLLRHFQKWSYTVCQGPKRSGRSRQGAPVPRIQNVPSSIIRRSRGGRPVRAFFCGINDSISNHCSSVSACRVMCADLPVLMEGYRQSGEFSDRA